MFEDWDQKRFFCAQQDQNKSYILHVFTFFSYFINLSRTIEIAHLEPLTTKFLMWTHYMLGCKNINLDYLFSQQGICQWWVVLLVIIHCNEQLALYFAVLRCFSFHFGVNTEGGLTPFLQLVILVWHFIAETTNTTFCSIFNVFKLTIQQPSCWKCIKRGKQTSTTLRNLNLIMFLPETIAVGLKNVFVCAVEALLFRKFALAASLGHVKNSYSHVLRKAINKFV